MKVACIARLSEQGGAGIAPIGLRQVMVQDPSNMAPSIWETVAQGS
jgi:hypothetical protein